VAHEKNNPLSLSLVLAMLERELSHLDGSEDVGVAIDLARVDAVDEVANVVGLSQSGLHPKEISIS
jgi:hypothetical protein